MAQGVPLSYRGPPENGWIPRLPADKESAFRSRGLRPGLPRAGHAPRLTATGIFQRPACSPRHRTRHA